MSSYEVGNRFWKSQIFEEAFANLFMCSCTNCCAYLRHFVDSGARNVIYGKTEPITLNYVYLNAIGFIQDV